MLAVLGAALSVPAAADAGYQYTDPELFGGVFAEDADLERRLPKEACSCPSHFDGFKAELRENLQRDPEFSGPWVHALCGSTYGVLFRFASLDPETGQLQVHDSQCTAGLAAMAAVCAQSAILRAQGTNAWHWHDAVVQEEGNSVGDYMGRIPVADCMTLCQGHSECKSFAHGFSGCHLKDRCSEKDDVLKPPEERVVSYRTYYLHPCPGAEPNDRGDDADFGGVEGGGAEAQMGEVGLLLDMALQLAEKAVHCFDDSGFSFTLGELIANRITLGEAMLGASGVAGQTAELQAFVWSRGAGPRIAGGATTADGPVYHALARATMRWVRRLNSEVGFWHILLNPSTNDEKGEKLERCAEDASSAQHWLATGEVQWYWEDDAELCARLAATRAEGTARFGGARLLNTGSGPLAPPPLDCSRQTDGSELGVVPVVAADGLARFYLKVFDVLSVNPPRVSAQCPVEELRSCYPRNHFDFVHMRNALDHVMDPLEGIRQMLEVVRPGGWVLLRHARNEGSPGHFQVGLHQWSFDGANVAGERHFYIWNPALRSDATQWLLARGLAAEVRTELRPHPSRDAADEDTDYVWVDIRKPEGAL